MLIGFLVDGQYVTVNRLESYLKVYGGKSLDFIFKK